ncbi:MAG: diguanylate cyclase, partial [Coriobacteriales bacterium]|nr:diguanylate cyclase [Coriobacteriales bacterium]
MDQPYFLCYLIVDITCIVITLIVTNNLRSDSGSEMQIRYFHLFLACYFAFVISDALWASVAIGGALGNSPVAYSIFNAINKISVGFTAYAWLGYAASYLKSRLVYNSRLRLIVMLPVILIPVLYTIGAAYGLDFTPVANQASQNGPIYVAITAIAMLYLLAATILAFRSYQREHSRALKRMYLVFTSFMIAPTIAAFVDALVPNLPLISPAILISILMVMFSLQESRISHDALTGLRNRRAADEYLDESLEHASRSHPVHVFLVDMDKFKHINDTYGHLEGDNALRVMAAALRATRAEFGAFVSRWGGDEFLVIWPAEADKSPALIESSVRANLAREIAAHNISYALTCSIGHAQCDKPNAQAAQLLATADEELYRNKLAAHRGYQ